MRTRASYEDARDHFVSSGTELTYAELAERFDLPLSTLQKRAARENWQEKRRERQALNDAYATKVKRLKVRALEELLDGDEHLDPQKIHAWRSLEATFPEHRYAKDLSDGERRQICGVLMEVLVDVLDQRSPTLVGELADHMHPLMEAWLAADWNRR